MRLNTEAHGRIEDDEEENNGTIIKKAMMSRKVSREENTKRTNRGHWDLNKKRTMKGN